MFGQIESTRLLHLWSLSIEEQFYLVFPVFLIALLKRSSRLTVARLLLALAVLSWAWRIVLFTNGADMSRLYNGTDTRLDGLLMGAALALLLSTRVYGRMRERMRRHRVRAALGVTAACGLIGLFVWGAYLWNPLTYLIVLGVTSLAVCGVIFACLTDENSWLTRLLAWGPLAYMGKLSYTLYLWHILINGICTDTLSLAPLPATIVGAVAGVAAAHLSYKYLEAPILRRKGRYRGEGRKSV